MVDVPEGTVVRSPEGDVLAEPLCQRPDALHVRLGSIGQEFLAADAAQLVHLPQPEGHALRHDAEHLVPGGVAEAVVHGLEVVEVDEHQRQALAEAPALVHLDLEHVEDVAPVEQAREGIADGLVVEAEAGVLQREQAAQLLVGDFEQALVLLHGAALGEEAEGAHGGIAGHEGGQHAHHGIPQGAAALVAVVGGMPAALGRDPGARQLEDGVLQGLAVLLAGGGAVDAVAEDPILAHVGHQEGAGEDELLEDLDEAADEPQGVVLHGVEAGDGVPQRGLHHALFQGLGQAALDGVHAEVLLGQPGCAGQGAQPARLLHEGGRRLHHMIQVPPLHEEAVRAAGLGPEPRQAHALGREQEHGQVARGPVVLEQAAELVAVQERHDTVAHHHVRAFRGEDDEGLGAVLRLEGGVPVPLEEVVQEAQLDGIVVHQEDLEGLGGLGGGNRHGSTISERVPAGNCASDRPRAGRGMLGQGGCPIMASVGWKEQRKVRSWRRP